MRSAGLKASPVILVIGLLGMVSGVLVSGGEPPSRAEFQRQETRCRELLRRSVFSFYFPASIDTDNGGYLEDRKDGKFVRRGEKFLTLQARQLWFFSTLALENIERSKCLEATLPGFLILERGFRDQRSGGYFSKTDDLGVPTDRRKHVYLNSFALYALVAYHQATRDGLALRRAQELFRVLDQHAYDARNGGFAEFFYENWRPVTNRTEAGYVGAIGTKTYNTHLHLLESYTALYRIWPDPKVRQRLDELLRIITVTVQHPVYHCNVDGWQPDWQMVQTPENLKASYGHDVECVWLGLDAVRALGLQPALYRGWAEGLAGYSLVNGYDAEHGGFFYTGPLGERASDTRKEWWVQAEALVGMLELYRMTGDVRYYEAFVGTLDFIEAHQVAADGGWWATLNEDGTPHRNASRSSMWQGAYHSGRALLLSAKILSNLNVGAH